MLVPPGVRGLEEVFAQGILHFSFRDVVRISPVPLEVAQVNAAIFVPVHQGELVVRIAKGQGHSFRHLPGWHKSCHRGVGPSPRRTEATRVTTFAPPLTVPRRIDL